VLALLRKDSRLIFFILSGIILITLLSHLSYSTFLEPVIRYGHFFIIGIFAATVANSTGAGGGIVFIPAFIALGLSPLESLATSFAIQCFGMTAGALSWLSYRRIEINKHAKQWHSFFKIMLLSCAGSITGIQFTQQLMPSPPIDVELLFSVFSLIVGLVILHRTLKINHESPGRISVLETQESILIFVACLVGGALTAWLSIAVGEILAIVLIFLGFRVNLAIAAAVCVTSVSVLSAIPFHVYTSEAVNLNVLVFAAPGALIGGALARRLAIYLGAHRLKIFMACWIIISAFTYFV